MQYLKKMSGNKVVASIAVGPRTDLVGLLEKAALKQNLPFNVAEVLMNLPGAGMKIGRYEYILMED